LLTLRLGGGGAALRRTGGCVWCGGVGGRTHCWQRGSEGVVDVFLGVPSADPANRATADRISPGCASASETQGGGGKMLFLTQPCPPFASRFLSHSQVGFCHSRSSDAAGLDPPVQGSRRFKVAEVDGEVTGLEVSLACPQLHEDLTVGHHHSDAGDLPSDVLHLRDDPRAASSEAPGRWGFRQGGDDGLDMGDDEVHPRCLG